MKINLIWILVLLIGVLAACSSADGPEQIAVYPKEEPIAIYPRLPETVLIYNATLDIEVFNIDRAAERAKEIAFDQNGYLVSAQSWYRVGEKHTTVVLAVPAVRFDNTRDDLLRLGVLAGEWISSEMVASGNTEWEPYFQITVYLHPKDSGESKIFLSQWRPVRTFEKAWDVFISIFAFLVDIVIWVTVVAGPFLLIGWSGKKFLQWRSKM